MIWPDGRWTKGSGLRAPALLQPAEGHSAEPLVVLHSMQMAVPRGLAWSSVEGPPCMPRAGRLAGWRWGRQAVQELAGRGRPPVAPA